MMTVMSGTAVAFKPVAPAAMTAFTP